jgi:hypothetical protein
MPEGQRRDHSQGRAKVNAAITLDLCERFQANAIITHVTGVVDVTSVTCPFPVVSSSNSASPAWNDRASPVLAMTVKLPDRQKSICRLGDGCGSWPPHPTGNSMTT